MSRTAEQNRARNRRPEAARKRTLNPKRTTKRELAVLTLFRGEPTVRLPATRGDCRLGPRPCPFVRCRYHLYLDVNPRTGSITLNFPELEVWEMVLSCALDVADKGGARLEDVGAILNLTRERVRQIELEALARLEVTASAALREHVEPGPRVGSRLRVLEPALAGGAG